MAAMASEEEDIFYNAKQFQRVAQHGVRKWLKTHLTTRNCYTTQDIKRMQLYGDLSYEELVSTCEAVEGVT